MLSTLKLNGLCMQADPALKIGALFCIDSICQQVGEPYVSYFSTNIAQVRQMSVQILCHMIPSYVDAFLMCRGNSADVLGNMEICKWKHT